MKILFDAHSDTLTKIIEYDGKLRKNNFHIDLLRMVNNRHIQVFAIYLEEELKKKFEILKNIEYFNKVYEKFLTEMDENKDIIEFCPNKNDILSCVVREKIAAILSIEGGEFLENNIENLYKFYKKGVRILTLVWKNDNEIAGSANTGSMLGVTDFGKNVIKVSNEIGITLDVSHICREAFFDVIDYSTKPIIASHSNCMCIHDHIRNLSNEQILAIIKNNGVIGINFNREFLTNKSCNYKNIIEHIEHIFSLGGVKNVGFGSDFDGINETPIDIYSIEHIWKLYDILSNLGYKIDEIEGIFYKNFLRLFI